MTVGEARERGAMLIGVDLVDDGVEGIPPIAERVLALLMPHVGPDFRLVLFCRRDSPLAAPAVLSPYITVEALACEPATAMERDLPGVYPIDLLFCPLGRIALNWPSVPVVTAFYAPAAFFSRFGVGAFDLAAGDALYAAHRAAISLVTFERARDILLQTTRRPAATILNVPPLPPALETRQPDREPDTTDEGPLVVVHTADDETAAVALLDECRRAFDAGAFGRLTIVTRSAAVVSSIADRYADLVSMTAIVDFDDCAEALMSAATIVLDDHDGTSADVIRTILSYQRPTIVADRGGLVEWSAGAVLGYDPGLQGALADAIIAVDRDGLPATPHADPAGDAAEVVDYPAIFGEAIARPGFADYVSPVHTDGWVGETLVIGCGPASGPQRLDVDLATDHGMPSPNVVLEVLTSTGDRIGRARFPTGCPFRISCELPAEGGALHVRSLGLSLPAVTNPADYRRLGFRFDNVSVTVADQSRVLAPAWPASQGYWLALVADGDEAMMATTSLARDQVRDLTVQMDITPQSCGPDGSVWLRSPRGTLEFRIISGAAAVNAVAGGDVLCWEAPHAAPRQIDMLRLIEGGSAAEIIRFDSKKIGDPPELAASVVDKGKFSVVIPSFNQGRYLAQAVQSALDQDNVADIHVMDAGSTDDSAAVLAAFGDRITATIEPDEGQADAVNKGIVRGTGEFIAWLNSDDMYLPDAFARVAQIFANDPSIDVIYGEADHVDELGRFLSRYPVEPFDLTRLRETCFLCQPATFIRRSALGEHGMLRKDLHLCLDYELWLRIARGGGVFERTYQKLALSRLHTETKTLGQRVAAHHETSEMFAQCFGEFSAKWAEAWAAMIAADRGLHHLDGRVRAIARAFWLRRARRFRARIAETSRTSEEDMEALEDVQ